MIVTTVFTVIVIEIVIPTTKKAVTTSLSLLLLLATSIDSILLLFGLLMAEFVVSKRGVRRDRACPTFSRALQDWSLGSQETGVVARQAVSALHHGLSALPLLWAKREKQVAL
jgi:hypothetical protein